MIAFPSLTRCPACDGGTAASFCTCSITSYSVSSVYAIPFHPEDKINLKRMPAWMIEQRNKSMSPARRRK